MMLGFIDRQTISIIPCDNQVVVLVFVFRNESQKRFLGFIEEELGKKECSGNRIHTCNSL